MATLGHRSRRIIDRDWIRVGWAGRPTLRHHLIAFTPAAILLIPATLVEQRSYRTSAALLLAGFLAYLALMVWIHVRGMAGLGYFSTIRSDRIAKRQRRSPASPSVPTNADQFANDS